MSSPMEERTECPERVKSSRRGVLLPFLVAFSLTACWGSGSQGNNNAHLCNNDGICDLDRGETFANCPDDCPGEATITCDRWNDFLDVCDGCAAPSNCASTYHSYSDPHLLDDLDWCSDCLAAEANYGTCSDCEPSAGNWCTDLLDDYLGYVCW